MTAAPPDFRVVKLALIDPSPKNPRKLYPGLDELAASIAEVGVLEPLLVRPFDDRFEVVAGERRRRASKLAKLTEVPVIVRELDDKTARSIMMHENLNREDLNAIEEADGYFELMQDFGYSVDQLAHEYSRKARTIYAALQLRKLGDAGRLALIEERLFPSVGLLIARIPGDELQERAVKDLAGDGKGGDPVSYHEAQEFIQRNFMLRLELAEFDLTDAELVPAAGPCTKCPKRTGNQRELFSDIKSADVCTDPACFRAKTDALVELKFKTAEEQHRKVLRAAAAKKLFSEHGQLKENSGYVLSSGGYTNVPGRGWGDITKLVQQVPASERVLVQEPGGKMIELVPVKALPKRKKKAASSSPKSKMETPEQKTKRVAEEALEHAKAEAARATIDALVKRVEKRLGKPELLLVIRNLDNDFGLESVAARRDAIDGSDFNLRAKAAKKLEVSLPRMSEAQLRGVLFELVAGFYGFDDELDPAVISETAKELGMKLVEPKPMMTSSKCTGKTATGKPCSAAGRFKGLCAMHAKAKK